MGADCSTIEAALNILRRKELQLDNISLLRVILSFILGGAAVTSAGVIAKRIGGKLGGIFAAFPAVYLSAVFATGINLPSEEALLKAVHLSQGALVGMSSDIICAVLASILIARSGWKKGLLLAIVIWFFVACGIFFTFAYLGVMK
jgi:hypothetical protein